MGEGDKDLGRLEGLMEGLVRSHQEDKEVSRQHRAELRQQVGHLERDLAVLTAQVAPIAQAAKDNAEKLKEHEKEIAEQTLFRKRIGSIIGIASAGFMLLASGLWYMIDRSWDWIVLSFKGWASR